jgi:phosphatidylglycerol:prolipoprotein diacylglycerol transferase
MLAIAVVVGSFFLSRDAHRRYNISDDVVFDLVFWTVLGGILGARVFYIFLNLDYFRANPSEIIQIQKGGIAWQGSLIAGALIVFGFIRKKKLPFPGFFDLCAPYIALGQAIGRVGCFLNGCCYGKPVEWGVYFPVHDAHLHPTQLYLSSSFLLVFILLKRYAKTQPADGKVFLLYLMLACMVRFTIEFWRGDHDSWTYLGLSVFQYICIIVFLITVYANTRLKSKS